MIRSSPRRWFLHLSPLPLLWALAFTHPLPAPADPASPTVELDASKSNPRPVEEQTGRRIIADYRFAWSSIAHSLETNSTEPLQGILAGTARDWLMETVSSQRQSGLTTKYILQHHKLEAVFYAPAGDVMELHDTADYQLQVFDGGRLIHNDHVVAHYIVLMTPGADRWVIRQLQAVKQF